MAPTPKTRRRRQTEASTSTGAVSQLKGVVDQLLKENRTLKRQVAKLEAAGGSSKRAPGATVSSGLRRLRTKIERALASPAPGTRSKRTTRAAATKRPRKPITDPVVLEKRRQALAKARAARASRKAAATES